MSQVYAISDTVTGAQFRTDHETGLLFSNQVRGFTLLRKKKFLEIAPKYWPNVSLICKFVGLSKTTYKIHYMHDKVFRDFCDSLSENITDDIEAAMAKHALEKSNFMDRIAWLRAHRGEKYNDKKIIQVDVNLTKERIDAKKESLSQAIDTSIVTEGELVVPIAAKTPEKPA